MSFNIGKFVYAVWCFSMIAIMTGCSVKKYIPEDEYLYSDATLDLNWEEEPGDKNLKEDEIRRVLYPKPNSKLLGMRPGLYFHYRANHHPNFINRFLNRKWGQEPVYLSDVNSESVEELIVNRLENRGYFFSQVDTEVIKKEKSRKAALIYHTDIPKPYTLHSYQIDADSLPIYQKMAEFMDSTFMIPGRRFDLQTMKEERGRIDRMLKDEGYYNFNSEFLIFEADTNRLDAKNFDLFLRLKDQVPPKSTIPYRINQVNVYSNYKIGQDSLDQNAIRYNDKNYIQKEEYFKPKRLDPFILIEENSLYNPGISSATSRRLGSSGAYKFINIRYDVIDTLNTGDSTGWLNANIYLSPLNMRAIRLQLQAVTKSNSFTGPSLAMTYSNRNLFGGGEVFNLTTSIGYETQIRKHDQKGLNSTLFEINGDLIFPRVLFPSRLTNWFKYAIPKTRINLGGKYVSRTRLFTMGSIQSSYGYTWDANKFVTHELIPVSVTYLNLLKSTSEFEYILEQNPFLRSSFDQKFIAGLNYSYTYNGMVNHRKKHQLYLNSNIDIAGNLIGLMAGKPLDEPRKFLGMEFAQYAKTDIDLRYHINLGENQKLASRMYAGLGWAYGNSEVMPYSKQFYSGGPYSVRAFHTRGLGPGSYSGTRDGENTYFDQTGNIRLEANIEYRFPVFQYLKGAVFADAGNVWVTRDNPNTPGGRFRDDFYKEIGIGAGAGLRIEIQGFVIRLDLASPIHDPRRPENDRWIFNFKKPVINLAVGYPF